MTVHELLTNADSHELSEWIAYFNIENKEHSAVKEPTPEELNAKALAAFTMLSKSK